MNFYFSQLNNTHLFLHLCIFTNAYQSSNLLRVVCEERFLSALPMAGYYLLCKHYKRDVINHTNILNTKICECLFLLSIILFFNRIDYELTFSHIKVKKSFV